MILKSVKLFPIKRMKFKFKETEIIKIGTKRQIELFALLPIKIGNEIRWLENVVIEQQIIAGSRDEGKHWENIKFI